MYDREATNASEDYEMPLRCGGSHWTGCWFLWTVVTDQIEVGRQMGAAHHRSMPHFAQERSFLPFMLGTHYCLLVLCYTWEKTWAGRIRKKERRKERG